MDLIDNIFYGNYVASVCLKDSDEQRELLFQTVRITEEIEKAIKDPKIIEQIKEINELNDQYSMLKSADAFREGISFAFALIKGLD